MPRPPKGRSVRLTTGPSRRRRVGASTEDTHLPSIEPFLLRTIKADVRERGKPSRVRHSRFSKGAKLTSVCLAVQSVWIVGRCPDLEQSVRVEKQHAHLDHVSQVSTRCVEDRLAVRESLARLFLNTVTREVAVARVAANDPGNKNERPSLDALAEERQLGAWPTSRFPSSWSLLPYQTKFGSRITAIPD